MEAALRKTGKVEEEKRVESNGKEEICLQDNQLENAKAEMGEIREENQRLRMHLNRIMKDYQTLQMQLHDIVKPEANESTFLSAHDADKEFEESELISLSLGRTPSDATKDQNPREVKEDQQDYKQGLALGLHSSSSEMLKTAVRNKDSLKLITPQHNLEVIKKEAGESWPPQKVSKTPRSELVNDEVSQQNPVKKARVSVRVRCDTPTMNDGCQWRKYGQKIAKGNPCPRAYYRCTIAPTCPVRKQVQRCVDDTSILISTYEGTHNHPLPVLATTMASTTSAAASMLLSGSSTSGTTTTSSADLRGLNFFLSDNSNSNQYYLPHSSNSSSHPTITLDLTSTSSSSHFNKISSNSSSAPRYNATNLNFSSLESNPPPISWSNNGVLNYENLVPYNQHQVGNSLSFGPRQNQEGFYDHASTNQKGLNSTNPSPPHQTLSTHDIAAATKAITSDPSFQSALAAALNSIIGTNGGGGNQGFSSNKFGNMNLNLGDTFPVVSHFTSTADGNKCSSSYLNRLPPVGSSKTAGSMIFMQPAQSPFSKSRAASPTERDHNSI